MRNAKHGKTFALGYLGLLALLASSEPLRADESGIGFWVPGFFGSLAAVPQQAPGWPVASIYYHTSVSAGGDVARAREIQIGQIPANLTATLDANVKAKVHLGMVAGTYVFATPVFGGQASASLLGLYGANTTSLAGSLTGTLTTPLGAIPFSRFDSIDSSIVAFGDLVPQFALRWNAGVHNYMTYVTGDIPLGAYDSTRLANLGLGHGAIDAGGGYTYLNPQTGHEFSAVLGFTYNFKNTATQPEWGRRAPRLGRLAIRDRAGPVGTGRLPLSADRLRYRFRRSRRMFPIPCGRHRAAVRLHLSAQGGASGIPQPERLLGIRGLEQTAGLEHLADVRDLADAGHDVGQADRPEILVGEQQQGTFNERKRLQR